MIINTPEALLTRVASSLEAIAPRVNVFPEWDGEPNAAGTFLLGGRGEPDLRPFGQAEMAALSRWLGEASWLDRYMSGPADTHTLMASWKTLVEFLRSFGDVFHAPGENPVVGVVEGIRELAELRFGFGLAIGFSSKPGFWLKQIRREPGFGGQLWAEHAMNEGMSEQSPEFAVTVVRLWVQERAAWRTAEPLVIPSIDRLGGPVRWQVWPRTPIQFIWWSVAVTLGAIETPIPISGAYECAGCGIWFVGDRSRARKDTERRFHDERCGRRFHARESAKRVRAGEPRRHPGGKNRSEDD